MNVARQIDGFLARYTPAIEAELRAARSRLRVRFPRGHELVFDNYNALVFAFGPTDQSPDAFVSVAGYPRWVTLFFLGAAAFDDPQGLLQGTGRQVRSIRLTSAADLDAPAVAALIDQAIALHAAALAMAPRLATTVRMIVQNPRPRRPAAKTARKSVLR